MRVFLETYENNFKYCKTPNVAVVRYSTLRYNTLRYAIETGPRGPYVTAVPDFKP